MCLQKPCRKETGVQPRPAVSAWMAEAGGQFKDSLGMQWIPGQPGPHRKNMSKTEKCQVSGDRPWQNLLELHPWGGFLLSKRATWSPQLICQAQEPRAKEHLQRKRESQERPAYQIPSGTSRPCPLHRVWWVKSSSLKPFSFPEHQGQGLEASDLKRLLSDRQPFVGSAG